MYISLCKKLCFHTLRDSFEIIGKSEIITKCDLQQMKELRLKDVTRLSEQLQCVSFKART